LRSAKGFSGLATIFCKYRRVFAVYRRVFGV
jgi:hypothetical protein